MTTMTVTDAFTITEEILVRASLEKTFASLITQMGRLNETPDGKPLPMVLEARPGGRWYRELGADNGHLWGFVQSIKRPVLLEIWGPLFMSTAATSNLMYRLTEAEGGTLITFTHTWWVRSRGSPPGMGKDGLRCTPRRPPKPAARKSEETTMAIIDALSRSSNRNRKPRGACSNACPEASVVEATPEVDVAGAARCTSRRPQRRAAAA